MSNKEFKLMDDSPLNNGYQYTDEVMIMVNGVWQVMDEEKKQAGIDAITQSLHRNQSTTTPNRNGNFNCTNFTGAE